MGPNDGVELEGDGVGLPTLVYRGCQLSVSGTYFSSSRLSLNRLLSRRIVIFRVVILSFASKSDI